MGGGKSEKRQRKKEAREAKRRAQREAARRARRQRIALVALTGLIIVGGGAAAFFLPDDETIDVTASPSPPTEATPETPAEDVATPDPGVVACDPEPFEPEDTQKPTFEEPEDQELDPALEYTWHLETTCGGIDIRLAVDRAPETTNSIAFLTREGFFDGLTFHRVARGFVIQGGDPSGDGTGGPGYQVEEPPPDGISYTRALVAMAKAADEPPGTSGSQFFVVAGDTGLTPDFALVGEVTSGMDVVDSINNMVPEGHDGPPQTPVHIIEASLIEA